MPTPKATFFRCPGCAAATGEKHRSGCDVERCPHCGHQALSCDGFDAQDPRRGPWTGLWPGVVECREYGLYAHRVDGLTGWQPCGPDDDEATEDLNRLEGGMWDATAQRWLRS